MEEDFDNNIENNNNNNQNEENNENENKKEDNNENNIQNDNHNENNINNFEESPKEENNNFNLEMVNNSDYSDDINNGELERPHIANHENIPIPFSKMILNKIEIIFTLAFFVFYIFDLFAYGFAFYRDSNNVPFL